MLNINQTMDQVYYVLKSFFGMQKYRNIEIKDKTIISHKLLITLNYDERQIRNLIISGIIELYTNQKGEILTIEQIINRNNNINEKIDFDVKNIIGNINFFFNINPFMYDDNGIFWLWNITDYKWEIKDDIDIMNLLDDTFNFSSETISNSVKSKYIEAIKRRVFFS